jgi:hypothetical protein
MDVSPAVRASQAARQHVELGTAIPDAQLIRICDQSRTSPAIAAILAMLDL